MGHTCGFTSVLLFIQCFESIPPLPEAEEDGEFVDVCLMFDIVLLLSLGDTAAIADDIVVVVVVVVVVEDAAIGIREDDEVVVVDI